ncbi:terpenoid synthase [Trametes elegans]|nr:terpenoid synthase [Trametes elegans]
MSIVSEHPAYLALAHPTSLPIPPHYQDVDAGVGLGNMHDANIDVAKEPLPAIQNLIRGFLNRCAYQSPNSKQDDDLRRWLAEQVAQRDIQLAPAFLTKSIDASCIYVETVYAHTPPEHRRYIALYTVCMLYADDLGEHDPDAIMGFTHRFATGEQQPNDLLECLAGLLRRAHALWPHYGADAIITGTLEALTAAYVENTTREMVLKPLATRYPTWLRLKAGIAAPFTNFVFADEWKDIPQAYLQIIPEIDYWTLGTNDVLSFYKEELAGETNNCVHMRATVEQITIEETLSRLVEEVLETAKRITAIAAHDEKLAQTWMRYMHGYLEFHLKTPRYRLAELGFCA